MADKKDDKQAQKPEFLEILTGFFTLINFAVAWIKDVPVVGVVALILVAIALVYHYLGGKVFSKYIFYFIISLMGILLIWILQSGASVQVYVDINQDGTKQDFEPIAMGGLDVYLKDSNGLQRDRATGLDGKAKFPNVPSGDASLWVGNGSPIGKQITIFQRALEVGITPTPSPTSSTTSPPISPTETPLPTNTPVPPTFTPTLTETNSPTITNTAENSRTPTPPPSPTSTKTLTNTPTLVPTHPKTYTPQPSETWTPSPIPPSPTEPGATIMAVEEGTKISIKDGMVQIYIPAGEFDMGRVGGGINPLHSVNLTAYWIDRTEITNAMYALCVATGACSMPQTLNSKTHDSYYRNSTYADYPVIEVSWHQANEYCLWAGRNLPTEAQWEKAGRGTDGRFHPWGGDILPNKTLVNINNYYGDSLAVTDYLGDISFYRVWGMGGNVQEWVFDWFNPTYYEDSSAFETPVNPTGPNEGTSRVVRGSSWLSDDASNVGARLDVRYDVTPDQQHNFIGFRCAENIP